MPVYRKTYICESITIRLTEDWKHSLDMGQPVCILSTDMSKAFDSMHHNLLMAKLKPYGLTDNSMKLINSYFQDRENRTRIQDTTKSWKPMRRGCPQGSSLGPLLWNVFQNDLFYLDRESQLSTFADDHQVYSSGSQPEIAEKNC